MNVDANIHAVLNHKGFGVWSIAPDTTVFEAIQFMSDKNIGALVVLEDDALVGIFSERDYTRNVFLKGRSSKQTRVREIMRTEFHAITQNQTVEEAMRIMTEKRVRHLPVVEDGKVVGIVSIGNLVNWIITAQSVTIDHLQDYISGKYPG